MTGIKAGDEVRAVPGEAAAFPLTCRWCSNRPATRLAVFDPKHGSRQVVLLCEFCGERGAVDVVHVAASPASWWLFELVPARSFSPEEARDA